MEGRSPCGVVCSHLDWGSGPHPEAHVHDGRVRRTVASVDQRQDILRIVNSRYGLRGVRVGEASQPGPASKRRRTQRMRSVPWSWDSDGESSSDDIHRPTEVDSDSEDEQPLVRPVRVPSDVVEALEHDLCEGCRDPAAQLSCAVLASVVPTTVPQQGFSVRCIELEQCKGVRSVMLHDHHEDWSWFHSQLMPLHNRFRDRQWERDAGAESHNRFSPLQDTVIDAQEADLIPVPGSVLSPVPQSEPAPTQWASGPEFVRRGPDFDSESREGFESLAGISGPPFASPLAPRSSDLSRLPVWPST